jgi:hypothetical protein
VVYRAFDQLVKKQGGTQQFVIDVLQQRVGNLRGSHVEPIIVAAQAHIS